ncbi:MAG: hypothetical protein ACP5OR_09430 [Candidatus Dormibacteria bacterium]
MNSESKRDDPRKVLLGRAVILFVIGILIGAVAVYAATIEMGHSYSPSNVSGSIKISPGVNASANSTTSEFIVMLVIGPPADMVSVGGNTSSMGSQNASMSNGSMAGGMEYMLSGQMTNVPMGDMYAFHLEVHIYDKSTGKVVVVPPNEVTISITNESNGSTVKIPIAVMYDPMVGVQDIHYGNNVLLAPGNFTVSVDVSGQSGTFHLQVSMSMGQGSMSVIGEMHENPMRHATPFQKFRWGVGRNDTEIH